MTHDNEQVPCFVGGTGRSGTTVLGRLIGRHERYGLVKVEAKFHALMNRPRAEPSLPDLLSGRASLEAFLAALRGFWFHFTTAWGHKRGLCRFLTQEQVDAAAAEFERAYVADPWAAAGALLDTLFRPQRPDAVAWVEMSPANIRAAPVLARCVPTARFVHVVRDGRDAASSIATQKWGPTEWDASLRDWCQRLERADAGAAELDPARLLVIHLEDLIADGTRMATYQRLRDFLHIRGPGGKPMRKYFDRHMDGRKANIGRWREGLPAAEVDRRDAAYRVALDELAARRGGPVIEGLRARLG